MERAMWSVFLGVARVNWGLQDRGKRSRVDGTFILGRSRKTWGGGKVWRPRGVFIVGVLSARHDSVHS